MRIAVLMSVILLAATIWMGAEAQQGAPGRSDLDGDGSAKKGKMFKKGMKRMGKGQQGTGPNCFPTCIAKGKHPRACSSRCSGGGDFDNDRM